MSESGAEHSRPASADACLRRRSLPPRRRCRPCRSRAPSSVRCSPTRRQASWIACHPAGSFFLPPMLYSVLVVCCFMWHKRRVIVEWLRREHIQELLHSRSPTLLFCLLLLKTQTPQKTLVV